ncbi:MAG TPA: hypothetical protein GXX17_01585 [Clostridiales bacterium]|nr:hypothetical protein [Clostridiales bacterium]
MKFRFIYMYISLILAILLIFSGCSGNLASPQPGSDTANGAPSPLGDSHDPQEGEEDMHKFIPRPKDPEVLSKEQEDKIKADYVEYLKTIHPGDPSVSSLTAEDIAITEYLGTFNGAVAIFITPKDSTYPDSSFEVKVSRITITFPAGPPFYIYKDSQFKEIKDAYEAEWINLFDLRDLKYFINGE